MSNLLSSDWKVVRLEEVAEIQKGTSFTSKELEPGDVPVIAGGREPAYYHKCSNRPPNTITVSASGDAGYVSFHREPIFATDCTTVRSKPQVSVTNYIYHFLKHHQNKLYRLRTGSALPHVYPRDIARFQITLPLLEKQINIADILDSVEEEIEQTENVINKTEQLRYSLLHELLSRGLPGHHKKWKEVSGLDTIPASWQVVRLSDISEIITGNTPPRANKEYYGGQIPWVKPSDLRSHYVSKSDEYLTTKGVTVARLVPEGSVLVSCIGTVGEVAIAKIPLCFNQQINGLIPNNIILPSFLYWSISYRAKYIQSIAPKTAVPILNKREFSQIRISLPSLFEQEKIMQYLDSIDTVLEHNICITHIFRRLSESLRNNLLTKFL